MKRKPGWFESSPPQPPYKPCEPLKTHVTYAFTELAEFVDSETKLVDLEQIGLPEGVTRDQVVLQVTGDDQYQSLKVGYYVEKCFPNPFYASERKRYGKAMATYEKQLEAHCQELKDWEAWSKAEKEKATKKAIAAAEALLRKHGRLK